MAQQQLLLLSRTYSTGTVNGRQPTPPATRMHACMHAIHPAAQQTITTEANCICICTAFISTRPYTLQPVTCHIVSTTTPLRRHSIADSQLNCMPLLHCICMVARGIAVLAT
jgi:hypothetical protein